MSHEDHFLAEIQADPQDAGAKLIYADWLEDHGDARAEIIRVREHLKTLSPIDKTYWDFKDRFRELRQQQETDWLAALEYDAVYRPMLANFPEDRPQRWRLLEEFIEFWHEPLTRESGYTYEELEAVEDGLNSPLPAALREWYSLAGKQFDSLFRGLDFQFRSPMDILVQDVDFEETFFVLNRLKEGTYGEYVFNWGFTQQDMYEENPGFRDRWHEPFDDPANTLGCVSSMVFVLLLQFVFRFGSECTTVPWNSATARPFEKLQFVEQPQWSELFSYGNIYEGVDLLLKQPSYPLPIRLAQRSDLGSASLPKDVQSFLAEM